MAESAFGTLLNSFFDGSTGRRLLARGREGRDAMLLALWLTANEFANMIGLYELSVAKIERSLVGFKRREIIKLFGVLAAEDFAYWDEATDFVWIREMARVRLQLNGEPLKRDDKRRLGALRRYETLPSNPFLGAFFDRYHLDLSLPQKREGASQAPYEGASQGVSQGASEGACEAPPITSFRSDGSGITDQTNQGSEIRDQGSEIRRTPAAPARPSNGKHQNNGDNYRVIARIAHEILVSESVETEADLRELAKTRCAQLGVPYATPDDNGMSAVTRACAAEWFKHRHPDLVGGSRR